MSETHYKFAAYAAATLAVSLSSKWSTRSGVNPMTFTPSLRTRAPETAVWTPDPAVAEKGVEVDMPFDFTVEVAPDSSGLLSMSTRGWAHTNYLASKVWLLGMDDSFVDAGDDAVGDPNLVSDGSPLASRQVRFKVNPGDGSDENPPALKWESLSLLDAGDAPPIEIVDEVGELKFGPRNPAFTIALRLQEGAKGAIQFNGADWAPTMERKA